MSMARYWGMIIRENNENSPTLASNTGIVDKL